MDQQEIQTFADLMLTLRQALHQNSSLSIEERIGSGLQYAALHRLHEQQPANVSDLAASLHISLSSATQLIERMARAELVERTPSEQDRRVTNLHLTRHGKREMQAQEQAVCDKMGRILSKVPERDRGDLIRILSDLVRAMNEPS